jgi:hypothetical protein
MRRILRGALVSWALAAVCFGSACAMGGGVGGAGPSPSAMSDAEILAIGKQVADCLRNNGIPDFPDPTVERGKLKLPEQAEGELEAKYTQQVLEQAEQSCRPLMDRLPQSAVTEDSGTKPGEDGPVDVETMKRLAQCLRDNGIPEWPDPRPDGSFPIVGTPLEAEGKSQRFLAAGEKCQQYWTGSITYS